MFEKLTLPGDGSYGCSLITTRVPRGQYPSQTSKGSGIIEESTPPKNREKYLEIEKKLVDFANHSDINIDELDLLLWSMKTGEVLK